MPRIVRRYFRSWMKPPTEFEVYTKEEADERGIRYVYWKDAEIGDMVLTDDDWVGLCLNVHRYPYGDGKRLRTVFGQDFISQRLEAGPRIESGDFRGRYKVPRGARYLTTARVRQALIAYTLVMIRQHGRLSKYQWRVLASIAQNNGWEKPKWFRRLLRNEHVVKYVAERFAEILSEQGLPMEKLLSQYARLVDECIDEGTDESRRLARDTLDFLLKLSITPVPPSARQLEQGKVEEAEWRPVDITQFGDGN
jgi:hypothetical protein